MGNLCGKQSNDPFAQPGRTLNSAPPPAQAPRSKVPRVGGPGRTLGGPVEQGSGDANDDARKRAGEAAAARATATQKPVRKSTVPNQAPLNAGEAAELKKRDEMLRYD